MLIYLNVMSAIVRILRSLIFIAENGKNREKSP